MTLSRALIIAAVFLSSYAAISTLVACGVALTWRWFGLERSTSDSAARARQLVLIRAIPTVTGLIFTLVLVMPGYLEFEAPSAYERVGPLLITLAIAGGAVFVSALLVAMRAVAATVRLERRWMATAEPLETARGGVPAFVVESPAPVVALVGVFSPKLLASRSVIDACSDAELATIVAHEHGHLRSRDNLKRWFMASVPDMLRWTPIHDRIVAAWHDAAEDAADDVATSGEQVARAELAALVLKVARLSPAEPWAPAMVSPFADPQGLDRRVRRLLQETLDAAPTLFPNLVRGITVAAVAMVAIAVSSATILEGIHEIVERVVGLGR
jgi:beta-lactamase regulating signal transducer with metallopeptidase domain